MVVPGYIQNLYVYRAGEEHDDHDRMNLMNNFFFCIRDRSSHFITVINGVLCSLPHTPSGKIQKTKDVFVIPRTIKAIILIKYGRFLPVIP